MKSLRDLELEAFLESLPENGHGRTIARDEYDIANRAVAAGDAFHHLGHWPDMFVSRTFEGLKTLTRLRAR